MVGKVRLVVAVEDEIYLDRLCDYLETEHGRFVTERFCDKQALADVLHTEMRYDAILFEPDMIEEETLKQIERIKILLGDRDNLEMVNGCYSIREYQKTNDIADNILNICSSDRRFMGIEVNSTNQTKLYSFTSPVGGTGVTTVSLGMAIQAAKQGKKVLYVCLEQIPSIGTLLPITGLTMTQIMRMAIENSPKLLTSVEGGRSIEPESGLEYFGGFGDATDFDSLEPGHMGKLASCLCGLGRYDIIITDLAWNTRLDIPILEVSDKIFLISRNTSISTERVNTFLRYASEKELSYRNRLQVVVNALGGSMNGGFLLPPVGTVPLYQMVIDAPSFAAAALNGSSFSDSLSELVGRL